MSYAPVFSHGSVTPNWSRTAPLPLPPPHPVALPPPPRYLYHYTDEHATNSIMSRGIVVTSVPVHATHMLPYGDGIYLTRVSPDAPNEFILQNNWNKCDPLLTQSHFQMPQIAKLQYCFAFQFNDLCPWAMRKIFEKNGRDIWQYKQNIHLSDTPFTLIRRW